MNKTICLCMIVKDEEHVIERCLDSVKTHIDHFVVVDTGSSDRTKELVLKSLSDIPGQVYDRLWVNFGHNRSEALRLARETNTDYSLILDADDIFQVESMPKDLCCDAYSIEISSGPIKYDQLRLFSNKVPWVYEGAVHEYPTCYRQTNNGKLEGVKILSLQDGHSWLDPNKYRRYALMFENELLKNPTEPRNVFYMAQCYRDCGDTKRAIEGYEARTKLEGWQDEVWYSLYQLGRLHEQQGEMEKAISYYLDAYGQNILRAEPLYELCRLYRQIGKYQLGYTFGKMALSLSVPREGLFIMIDAYGRCLCDELSICAYYIGKYEESLVLCKRALRYGHKDRQRILANKQFALKALGKYSSDSDLGFDFFDSYTFPSFLQFETNTICNAKCAMCPHEAMKKRPALTDQLLNRVISECIPLVKEVCPFLMQEPAMEYRLTDILTKIKAINPSVKTTIYSNMSLMTPDIIERLIDTKSLDSLCVSFYGPTENLYRNWQPPLNWMDTKANIRYAIGHKSRSKSDMKINIHYLAHPDLIPAFEAFKAEWKDADSVGLVHYDTFCGTYPEIDQEAIWGKQADKRTPCPRLWSTFNIHSNGHVVPCCLDHSEKIVLGDLNTESPKEIWRGKKFEDLRKMHIEGRFDDIPLCKDCNVWKHRHPPQWQSLW